MATDRSWLSATCSAMPSASAVLPMLGRAATTMTLPGCRPPTMRSRSTKPVATPVRPVPLSSAAVRRSMPRMTSSWARAKSPRTSFWDSP